MTESHADLVSVIIPTYNRANLLLQALTSVRRQTWPNLQIIVVDDGSTDNTAALMAEVPDVCFVRREHQGQGAARNAGLRRARGAFVCSLDSDDLWEPEFIRNSVQALRALNADFVFSNWVEQNAAGKRSASNFYDTSGWSRSQETELRDWRVLGPLQARAAYTDAGISPSSACLLRRELITGGWREDLQIADDWGLLLELVLSRPCRVGVCAQPRWVKRVFGDNISLQQGRDIKRYACVHDYRLLLRHLAPTMRARERARFQAKIAFHQAALARWERREKRVSRSPGLLLGAAWSLGRAFSLSPGTVVQCVREIKGRRRQDAFAPAPPCSDREHPREHRLDHGQ